MAQIRWTIGAHSDLREIVEFIARDSVGYATATGDKIFAAIERLAQFPRSGRTVPEYADPRVREVLVGPYRIIYKVDSVRVGIIAIVHGSRDVPRRLRTTGRKLT